MAIVGHSRLVIITNVIYYFNNLQVCAIEMGSVTRSGKGGAVVVGLCRIR